MERDGLTDGRVAPFRPTERIGWMIGLLEDMGVHPSLIFFLIFAICVILYGLVLWGTGDKDWLPMRLQPTVRTKEDVRNVGRNTTITGGVILVIICVGIGIYVATHPV